MAGEFLKVGDNVAAAVGAVNGGGDVAVCPRMAIEAAAYEPGPDGIYRKLWHERGENAVMTEGRRWVMNRIFAGNTSGSTAGVGFYLHSYTSGAPGTSMGWANVSASQVVLNANTTLPNFSMTASSDQTTYTWTTQYTVTQANATVYGGGVVMGTSASIRTAITAGEVVLYNVGTFANSQALASNNVLSVSATFSFA